MWRSCVLLGLVTGCSFTPAGGSEVGAVDSGAIDGAPRRFDVGAPAGFDFNADFTWHVYVRTSSSSGALFSRNPAGTAWNQGSKAMFVRSQTVQWDSGWVSNPHTDVAIDDGNWHQVIATYVAASDTLDVFVDPASTRAATTSTGSTSTPTSTTMARPSPGSRSARPTSRAASPISGRCSA